MVTDGYLKIAKNDKGRFVVIDGTLSKEEIRSMIILSIKNFSRKSKSKK